MPLVVERPAYLAILAGVGALQGRYDDMKRWTCGNGLPLRCNTRS
jgi:hypothetical protein